MDATHLELAGMQVPIYTIPTVIVGSGAAGLNCAEHLHELGQEFAVVTDCLGAGTSNNSGSDKQTYYKIGVFGDVPDSPMEFARSLHNGGMCHGDLAYAEALGSLPEFFHLVRNGVEFPCNRYGAFVGYKTDHDPRQRATSAGPKTSMQMVQRSLSRLQQLGARLFDGYEVIRLLTAGVGDQRRVVGCLALNLRRLKSPEMGLTILWAENVVLATGGPGELYATSVYPVGQVGNHGLALEIGAQANNLTESQFGLASTGFRWNLSGTYQQVIPTYFSVNEHGEDRREFLLDYYPSPELVAGNTFLKGYQWPFHAGRLQDFGSSIVDLAVEEERQKGRRVYLDFLRNPGESIGGAELQPAPGRSAGGAELQPALGRSAHGGRLKLGPFNGAPEARAYLERSGATQATPFERLLHMNPAAVDLYHEHGVDLRQPLEIAVCAQHCNGGLSVNRWWETTIAHLFAIGEVAGTHGVRPGGSALNAGQVGGLRAAQRIAARYGSAPDPEECLLAARDQVLEELSHLKTHLHAGHGAPRSEDVRRDIQARMTAHAGFLRTPEGARQALGEALKLASQVRRGMRITGPEELPQAIQNHHLALTHVAFLTALHDLLQRGGGSRGAYVIVDREGNSTVETKDGPRLPHRPENVDMRQEIIEARYNARGECEVAVTPARPLPEDDSWYENTWREWREGRIYD